MKINETCAGFEGLINWRLMMTRLLAPADSLPIACLTANVCFSGLLNGEPAPELNVSKWIAGGPVEIKPGTNTYVVVICHFKAAGVDALITNLSKLQEVFQTNGVVVVAVSDESTNIIEPVIKALGTAVHFAVGADNRRFTSLTYMKPVMRREIPYSFIIGTNGDMYWHGLPQRGLVGALKAVLDGIYKEKDAAKFDLANHQMEEYMNLVSLWQRPGKNEVSRNLLATRTNDPPELYDMAVKIATVPQFENRDFALANQALDEAQAIVKTNSVAVALGRAYVLFYSGQHEEGLNMATQALNWAQSPYEKTNVLLCIKGMKNSQESKLSHRASPRQTGTPASDPAYWNGGPGPRFHCQTPALRLRNMLT